MVDSLDVIGGMIGDSNTYEPMPENYAVYRALSPIFIRLSRQLQTEYETIADFQRKFVNKD
ncbi:hypothetical protein IV50_GL000399 [Weissella viridescens]|nr:hypothetical protein IV50_GL000399 [Weissella viridescens]